MSKILAGKTFNQLSVGKVAVFIFTGLQQLKKTSGKIYNHAFIFNETG
jgi:hypothetical protein